MSDPSPQRDPALESLLSADGFSPELPAALRRTERSGWPTRLLLYMLRDLSIGQLDVILPGGEVRSLRGSQPGPHGVLQIRSARLLSRIVAGGEVGFSEAYMDELWDSPDLVSLLQVLYLNEQRVRGPYERNVLGRAWGWLQHRLRANTRSGSRSNIEYHYDLGNDFYRLWLDPTMAYSSAVFASPGQSLEDAQRHKFDLICRRLELASHHHVLEIGSGWGGLAIHMARVYGCRVTSITLSREQLREAQLRAEAAGVADRIDFRLQDYRDVRGQFDRVASVEMYEAVGEAFWPTYFRIIGASLKPGGIAALQGITIDPAIFEQYRTKRDFIQKYIFPGGMLATPQLLHEHARHAGLVPTDATFHALDYARTLAHWHRAVQGVRRDIEQQFGGRFLRMWRYYLAYSECGFRTGSVDLMHLTLRTSAPA